MVRVVCFFYEIAKEKASVLHSFIACRFSWHSQFRTSKKHKYVTTTASVATIFFCSNLMVFFFFLDKSIAKKL